MTEHSNRNGWIAVFLFFITIPILLPIFGFSVWAAFTSGNDSLGIGKLFAVVALVSGAGLVIGFTYSHKAFARPSPTPGPEVTAATPEPSEPTFLP